MKTLKESQNTSELRHEYLEITLTELRLSLQQCMWAEVQGRKTHHLGMTRCSSAARKQWLHVNRCPHVLGEGGSCK